LPKNFSLFVGFVLVTLAGSGCVVIPIPPPEEKPFQEVPDWLTIGESSVDDVIAKLGEPTLRSSGWMLYREPHEGWGWMLCAAGAYGAGCSPSLQGETSGQFLLVEFDGERVVTDIELLAERGLCQDHQICYSGEFFMRPATRAEDIEAKTFSIPTAGCGVYTYSQTESDLAAGELVINGMDAGGLAGRSGFYRHVVPPGSHEWMITPSQSKNLPLAAATYVLECQGQEIIFLRYTYGLSSFWFNKIVVVDPKRGKKEIAERWLAVSTSQ
jgi:hypothetical protein